MAKLFSILSQTNFWITLYYTVMTELIWKVKGRDEADQVNLRQMSLTRNTVILFTTDFPAIFQVVFAALLFLVLFGLETIRFKCDRFSALCSIEL